MLCPERDRLFKEYRTAVDSFREAVAACRTARSAADLNEASTASEKLRLASTAADAAGEALKKHRKQHRC
jgi:hypothetical protein